MTDQLLKRSTHSIGRAMILIARGFSPITGSRRVPECSLGYAQLSDLNLRQGIVVDTKVVNHSAEHRVAWKDALANCGDDRIDVGRVDGNRLRVCQRTVDIELAGSAFEDNCDVHPRVFFERRSVELLFLVSV